NFNQGRGQGYNPQGNRNPNWADSRPPPQRGPNEVPYRGNFAPRGPNPNPNPGQYNRDAPKVTQPPLNRTGVRTVAPYVEYPPEYQEEYGDPINYEEAPPETYVGEEQPSYYPCEENYYVGEASQPSQSDQNMATGFQQIQERLSLNQTNLVEQIVNQGAASQQVLDEQSQRLTKVEETLKAHIANISASCSAKPAKEEVYDDSPSSSGTTS
ncbi:MAG: hypothetical protein GY821_02705, partial [Gammaproteobacteria bacterium]|nr:hypothetical protein [Gammaproteobacteria bacterium]